MKMLRITTPEGRVHEMPYQVETKRFYEMANSRKKETELKFKIEEFDYYVNKQDAFGKPEEPEVENNSTEGEVDEDAFGKPEEPVKRGRTKK